MSTDTLHDKIRSEVERRLAIARAAAIGGAEWRLEGGPFVADRHHQLFSVNEDGQTITTHGYTINMSLDRRRQIALHDPADAIRRYEYALKILERHEPTPPYPGSGSVYCGWCSQGILAPCPDVRDLAESLGIDTGGQP